VKGRNMVTVGDSFVAHDLEIMLVREVCMF
jgi:hypothetical protein